MLEKRKIIVPVLVLALCIFIAHNIMQGSPPASKGRNKVPNPLQVEVIVLQEKDFTPLFHSFGRVQAKTEITLFPLVGGRVIELHSDFHSGGYFEEGEVLLKIEPLDYYIELDTTKSEIANAELALVEEQARSLQAERDWQNQKKSAPDLVATDFALRKPQLKAAEANLEAAKAKLRRAQLNLERTEVVAPFNGRIRQVHVGVGSVVNSSTALAELYDISTLEVRLPINNADLPYLAIKSIDQGKQRLRVQFENSLVNPSEIWEGEIVRSEAELDANSQQLFLVAQLKTDKGDKDDARQVLKIGQYLRAQIAGDTIENALVIPNTSIYQGAYVYLAVAEGAGTVIKRQPIKLLWRNDSYSVIEEGLSVGNRLVTTPLGQVTSGTKISIKSDDATREAM